MTLPAPATTSPARSAAAATGTASAPAAPAVAGSARHLALALDERTSAADTGELAAHLGAWLREGLRAGVPEITVALHSSAAADSAALLARLGAQSELRPFCTLDLYGAEGPAQTAWDASAAPLHAHLLLGYDSRADLERALLRAGASARAEGREPADADVRAQLRTGALPPVDLLLVCGTRGRLPAVLPWHVAYAELLFVETPFLSTPPVRLAHALGDFARRNRTFGAVPGKA